MQNFGLKPKRKRPPKLRWKDNIKMYFKATGYKGYDWIQLALDKVQWRATPFL
jgi:hypothetical protein